MRCSQLVGATLSGAISYKHTHAHTESASLAWLASSPPSPFGRTLDIPVPPCLILSALGLLEWIIWILSHSEFRSCSLLSVPFFSGSVFLSVFPASVRLLLRLSWSHVSLSHTLECINCNLPSVSAYSSCQPCYCALMLKSATLITHAHIHTHTNHCQRNQLQRLCFFLVIVR